MATARLILRPLEEFHPNPKGCLKRVKTSERKGWEVIKPLRIELPHSWALCAVEGDKWHSYTGHKHKRPHIDVDVGYFFDGASGPVIDTDDVILAAMVHDIVCTVIRKRRAVKNYFKRHWLYFKILLKQGCLKTRAVFHLIALLRFNFTYELITKLRGKK